MAQLQIVVRAENRSSGDTGGNLDVAEDVQLGQSCEHADVEKGGTEAAAGECQPHLAQKERSCCHACPTQESLNHRPGFGIKKSVQRNCVPPPLDTCQMRYLPGRCLQLPRRHSLVPVGIAFQLLS